MTPIKKLAAFLREVITQENNKSSQTLAGYVVGELVGNYDNTYADLLKTNPDIERIGDLASDLEWSNGSTEELKQMWQELKGIVANLKQLSIYLRKTYYTTIGSVIILKPLPSLEPSLVLGFILGSCYWDRTQVATALAGAKAEVR